MNKDAPILAQSMQDFMQALLEENIQLKQQIALLHERLQTLAIRYDALLELNIHTANYAKTQSLDSLAEIGFTLQSMIPPPEYRCEHDGIVDDERLANDDFLTVYEDIARLAAELFPDEPYFQPYQSE